LSQPPDGVKVGSFDSGNHTRHNASFARTVVDGRAVGVKLCGV